MTGSGRLPPVGRRIEMKTPIRYLPLRFAACLSLFFAAGCSTTSVAVDAAARQTLFRVTKNENANYVNYDLLFDENGRIAAQPLEAYWIMAEDGGARAGLSSMERGLYDVAVEDCDRDAGRVAFKINGVEQKVMTVTVPADGQPARVWTTIAGRLARLTGVHLIIRPTWNPFSPEVQVRLAGLATDDGDTVEEVVGN